MNILKLQQDLKAAGLYTGAIDGKWGPKTEAGWTAWAKGHVIEGSTFPYDTYRTVNVALNQTMRTEYLPAMERALQGHTRGMKLLCTVMAFIEGFTPKTRSYKTRNAGNIGNTDSGKSQTFPTFEDGIKAQADYLTRVSQGKHPAYPFGLKLLKPFYSDEIAKHRDTYGIPPQLPGYRFTYSGKLSEFTKIYSTGARVLNTYVDTVISYFAQHGYALTPESKIGEIIELC